MLSLHERFIKAIQDLNRQNEFSYLLDALSDRKLNSYAEMAILIFLLTYHHTSILSMVQRHALEKLCRECFLHTTPNQLFNLLSQPKNQAVKRLFDQFVAYVGQNGKLQLQKRVRTK